MFLLDTNHCSLILQGHPIVLDHLAAIGQTPVMTCVIVQGELILMAERSARRAENRRTVDAFLREITIFSIDQITAHTYGSLKAAVLQQFGPKEKAKQRHTALHQLGFSENDLWIAAIALQYQLTLVSMDSDFQRMQAVVSLPTVRWDQP
ncbi:PilT protein domain protein (plasmid) [Herpetosiphon aurantiacus DSM 785]|uniref:PilT protein domain protein n=1 Tax=Herpetosiphon aurantiacus (strain ATCC 23779 / DSM 785 / 114-95) TaxID=316274 RepID=A9B8Z5_HERA2|nr:PilT protein domain protein [Herpetosiphon aurantiacus DSM 785]